MLAVTKLDAQQSAVFDNSLTVDLTDLDIFAFCSENVLLFVFVLLHLIFYQSMQFL